MKRGSLKYFILFCCVCFITQASAQDIHFSQFFNAPLHVNPALTGQFNGDYRFAGNFRNQWQSVTVPYRTVGISADARHIFQKQNIHAGISVYSDKTGDSRFSTNIFNIACAYSFRVGADSNQFITVGLQTGFTQRRIDYSALTFDQQFNGMQYDPSLMHTETFANDGYSWINLNKGVAYTWFISSRNMLTSGVSLQNMTSPDQSFKGQANTYLDWRLIMHGEVGVFVSDKFDAVPAFQWQMQGKFKELIMGGAARYHYMADVALYAGLYYRNKDAGYFRVGLDYDNIHASITYDVNTSSLRPASNSRGGIEVGLVYIFKQFRPKYVKHKICPNYI